MAMLRGAVSTRNYAHAARKAADDAVVELGSYRKSKTAADDEIWDPAPTDIGRIEADLLPPDRPNRKPVPFARPVEDGKAAARTA